MTPAHKRTAYSASLSLLLLGFLVGCPNPVPKPPPDAVTVQLKWIHQAQFAGFYVALENGYYDQENLRVTFLEGGQDIDIAEPVATGRADFGVVSPEDVILKRSQGAPLTAIAVIYRRSAVVFVSRESSGIARPSQFPGKTVAAAGTSGAVRDFELQFFALMKRLRLDLSQVKLVPYDAEYKGFLSGDVDVTAAFVTSGVIRLRLKGLRLNLIWPDEYGIHSFSDTIIANDRAIEERPEIVTRFLRASLKGWREAVGNPQAAVETTLKYARFPDPGFQTAMLEASMPLVHTGEQHIGWMTGEAWQGMHKSLVEQGLIAGDVDFRKSYSMRFLEKIYGGATP